MSLIYNATFDKNTRKLAFEDKAGNEIYSCTIPERAPAVDDITKPLTFRATQDGSTVALEKYGSIYSSFETSRDGGKTWSYYSLDTAITLNTGEEVSFRVRAYSKPSYNKSYHFKMTGKIEAWHNVMSMKTDLLGDTSGMSDPMADYEFKFMFSDCTSLTKAPSLPATRLAEYCYYGMFQGCQSLTKAPALPATRLARYCYSRMFERCQSLTEAPALPATTLAQSCYSGMFSGCQSLTKAPELPATTLANSCYSGMFSGCGSLNEVRCKMPSTISAGDIPTYTGSGETAWLSGVSSTGTFYTNADANWPSGPSGIPTSWNRVNVDDLTKPLTFKATQDGSSVKLTKEGSPSGSFQTSNDGGNTWSDYTLDSAITLNTGDEVSFRAKADRTSGQSDWEYFYFEMTGKIEAWHNVMSMIRTNDFSTYKSVIGYAFSRLFRDCKSLTKAPVLPATTLADSCYWEMFFVCESLTEAPELPATILAQDCYYGMFNGCRSLVKAPELTATTLGKRCYHLMFSGCRSLNEVHCKVPSSYSSSQISSYASSWLSGVSSTGTFYTNADANWPSGASGIPQNWTRVNT